MQTRSLIFSTLLIVAPALIVACSSSDDSPGGSAGAAGTAGTGGTGGTGGSTPDSGTPDTGNSPDGTPDSGTPDSASTLDAAVDSTDADTAVASSKFKVRIENVSGASARPTPVSPGVWAIHAGVDPLFTEGQADRGEGLERIAEEGNVTPLAAALATKATLAATGVYSTPVGASAAGPAQPGSAYEFTVDATPAAGKLSFASMFGQSNDVFIGPAGGGIPLFDGSGMPLAAHDVSTQVGLWDVGSEHNQPPGLGPDQAPRQAAANTGAKEGVVDKFTSGTRGLPMGKAIADVTVTVAGSAFTFKFSNVSKTRGAVVTPISPIFYAVHDTAFSLFTPGTTAKGDGLESLAEDGSPANLVTQYTGHAGVKTADAVTKKDGATTDGPALPGDSFTFTVTPDAAHPRLSFASMVGQTNDAFLALAPGGITLLDSAGSPRPAAGIEAEIRASLAVWDAGTEENQVPGLGMNQAPRQSATNVGPDDPTDGVRLYGDSTNDLAGTGLGSLVAVTITHGTAAGTFDVTIANTSTGTAFPGNIGPAAWATHDASYSLFTVGMPASAGIEHVSEDGDPTALGAAITGATGVGTSGIVNMPDNGSTAGPAKPGHAFHFTVTPDAAHRFLSFASMWAPSNDTFLAFDPSGIALLDSAGVARSDADLAVDVAAHLAAWDAGTEENQSGGIGPDQPPQQSAPNTGAGEGSGFVRMVPDTVWPYPLASEVVKVTITPMP